MCQTAYIRFRVRPMHRIRPRRKVNMQMSLLSFWLALNWGVPVWPPPPSKLMLIRFQMHQCENCILYSLHCLTKWSFAFAECVPATTRETIIIIIIMFWNAFYLKIIDDSSHRRRNKCAFVYPINCVRECARVRACVCGCIVIWCIANDSGHFISQLTAEQSGTHSHAHCTHSSTRIFSTKIATTESDMENLIFELCENLYTWNRFPIDFICRFSARATPHSHTHTHGHRTHSIEFEKLIRYSKQVQLWNNRRQIK